ncbi:MAG TPA: NADH-quinone oxidoreductase subunit M [Phycisphaerae bacterium]|nr:NADH-quinone oxidoreductase subunit M [Phycisphaerae bacterium]
MKIYAYSSILTCLIALPGIGSIILAMLPSGRIRLIRGSALALFTGMLVITVVAACLLNWKVVGSDPGLQQLQQDLIWIPSLNIHYQVCADPLSMIFMLAICILAILACIASYSVDQRAKIYYILLALLSGSFLGAVASEDLFVFYLFLTLAIFPAYGLVGLWGGSRREPAAMKMALFAMVGSMSMLTACIILSWASCGISHYPDGTLDIIALTHEVPLRQLWGATPGLHIAGLVFWLMLVGIAIRLGIPSMHMWLPDVIAESSAPTGMLIIGGNVLVSGYALLRILCPIMSEQSHQVRLFLILLGSFGSLYAALCGLAQSDLRRMISYWLICMSGIMLTGSALMDMNGISGILLLILACPVVFSSFLWMSHIIEKRAYHHDINRLGGLAQVMPDLLGFSSFGLLSAIGLPGLCLFAGEFLVLSGIFDAAISQNNVQAHWLIICGIVLLAALVLTTAYLLWAAERIFFGHIQPEYHHFQKLSVMEKAIFLPLIILAVALGLFMVALVLAPVQPILLDMVTLFGK